MRIKWLYLILLAGCSALAQDTAPSIDLMDDGNDLLTLSWASESNELYRVLFKTNLLQTQGTVLKDAYFATPPSNSVKISRGGVPSAFLYIDVQTVLESDIPYEKLSPGTAVFVGDFCITNEVQFDSLKDELGLEGYTFDFSSDVLIGRMGPVTSSISGKYQMDSVRETESAVLVVYNYVSYAPFSSPAFDKAMLVVKTEHRNKPVRLVFNRLITHYMAQDSVDLVLSLDPQQLILLSP